MSASASDTRVVEIGMPRLSDSMEEATILSWLKRPGDEVARGEPLVEVETDKATMVYEAETDGVLEEIVVDDGSTAALGAVIARIRVGDADGASAPPPGPTPAAGTPPTGVGARGEPTVEVELREAVRQALDEELARDERVFLFGEDVAAAGGVFAVTPGLAEKYGPARVFDTPISELAMTGAAYGAAITGKRPVLEIMFGDFLALSMDTLINQASKYWFLTGGKQGVPLVIRSVVGAGGRFGAIHSQMPVSWLTGITGLKIVAPATPADAKGLLKAAIRDENPVVFLEHKRLYSLKGEVGGDEIVRLGRARIAREGRSVTLVTAMKGVHDCIAAAEMLAADGIDAEVVDLRTLRPLDLETVLGSVAKTNRVAVVEEGPLTGGWAGEMLALIAEHGLGDLDDAWRIATPDTPIPYSPLLEDAHLPGPERIAAEVRRRVHWLRPGNSSRPGRLRSGAVRRPRSPDTFRYRGSMRPCPRAGLIEPLPGRSTRWPSGTLRSRDERPSVGPGLCRPRLRGLPGRQPAAHRARTSGNQPPRARAARRRVAEPRVADRARPRQPVGQHALRARHRARHDHERRLRRGASVRARRPPVERPRRPGRATRDPSCDQPRLRCALGAADAAQGRRRRVPLRRLSGRRRVVPRGRADDARREGVRLRRERHARRAGRLRGVRAGPRRLHRLRLVVTAPPVGDRRRAGRRDLGGHRARGGSARAGRSPPPAAEG